MNKEAFKKLAREEFKITQFSKPECFARMTEVFGVKGRTFQNWVQRDKVQPWFDKYVEMYFENKKKDWELLRLAEEFVKISKRLENI